MEKPSGNVSKKRTHHETRKITKSAVKTAPGSYTGVRFNPITRSFSVAIAERLHDAFSDYRIGPVLLSLLEDEEAARVGLASHFALGFVLHTTALVGS